MSSSEQRQRQHQLKMRLNADELTTIQTNADRAGLSLAGYARSTILGGEPPRQSRRPSVNHAELARVLAQLGKIGSNVNQMAKYANSGGWPARDHIATAQTDIHAMRVLVMKALGVTATDEEPPSAS